MLHTPQDSLGPAADSDLAVNRADVRLHSVRAQICQRRDLGIALALGDEGQDLRLSIAEPFASTGPIESNGAARPRRNIATRTTELLNTLRDNAFDPSGEPVAWFYDPPWTLPFRRRNEVAVTVTPR